MKTYYNWIEKNLKREMDSIIYEEGKNLFQRANVGPDPYDVADLVELYQSNLESITALNQRVQGLSNVLQ